ncbi:hypothetical protein QMG61_12490 [Cryobacterium sp. PH31-AA6]|uniref:hypothetical protein n=1 Tax=Cryobacterium sp. PH31-AA6 TaxID=3046205 RepID=UPI0024B8E75F|nr:hypothetical protein [Cryobacterium sp. PH31-AA6]MDJ0324574.1 hypothetical protein [Cryobacterium sp. PH31-AA6]
MIPQLVRTLVNPPGGQTALTPADAAAKVLGADPFDLALYLEQVWDAANVWAPNGAPAGPARRALWSTAEFFGYTPAVSPAWDHLGYAYLLENTRMAQIMRRVVQSFRSGEGLGVPSVATQRWLDATESLLFGAANPVSAWLSTSSVRPDPEAVRRNAYWRLFGMNLAFGTDDNKPFVYDRAAATNTTFVPLLEELLYEVWQAMTNLRNLSGVNSADDDRIYRLAEQLRFVLRSRRQKAVLAREELVACTALGWLSLSLDSNTPVVVDLRAQATSPADRLRIIGERVGLAPHSRSSALISMAEELSLLLRTLEANIITGPQFAWVLYASTAPLGSTVTPLGPTSRRVITEWSAATGRDLKARKSPVAVQARQLAGAR